MTRKTKILIGITILLFFLIALGLSRLIDGAEYQYQRMWMYNNSQVQEANDTEWGKAYPSSYNYSTFAAYVTGILKVLYGDTKSNATAIWWDNNSMFYFRNNQTYIKIGAYKSISLEGCIKSQYYDECFARREVEFIKRHHSDKDFGKKYVLFLNNGARETETIFEGTTGEFYIWYMSLIELQTQKWKIEILNELSDRRWYVEEYNIDDSTTRRTE